MRRAYLLSASPWLYHDDALISSRRRSPTHSLSLNVRETGRRTKGCADVLSFRMRRGVLIIRRPANGDAPVSLVSGIPFALDRICFSNRYFIIISLYGYHQRLDAWLMSWRSNFDQSKMDHWNGFLARHRMLLRSRTRYHRWKLVAKHWRGHKFPSLK